MARSPKYWYDIMIAEKNTFATLVVYEPSVDSSQTLLSDLKTTSKVAIWRLMFWCVACCAYALDAVFDLYKVFLEAIAAKSRYGTLPWYVSIAKAFQYGDSLTLVDLEWRYATIDESAQIIKYAAAKEALGIVNVKIATLSGVDIVPVGVAEEAAFVAYLEQKRPAGIRINVINEVSDELRLYLSVNYNPLVLTSSGALISDTSVYPVVDKVNEYLKSLDFDGKFELMKLIDYVQTANGVVSAYVTNATARYGANPFVSFAQSYYPNAGHMVIDPTTPLTTTITYTENA